jgi:hypothetical protein
MFNVKTQQRVQALSFHFIPVLNLLLIRQDKKNFVLWNASRLNVNLSYAFFHLRFVHVYVKLKRK